MGKVKEIIKVTWFPVLLSSLCCLSPLILVMVGLSTVSFAASLSDTLYGDYKWAFRSVGLIALAITTLLYLRKQKGICTLDQAKRRKNEIINFVLVVFIAGVIGYLLWLHVIVDLVGKLYKIW